MEKRLVYSIMLHKLKEKYIKLTSEKNFAEILRGSSISFLSKIFNLLMGFVFSILVTRWYGAEVMGIYSLVTVYMMFAGMVSFLGLNTSIVRMIPEHIAKFSIFSAERIYYKFFKLVFFLSFVTSIVAYSSVDFIAVNIFKKDFMSFLFAIASLFIIPQAFMSLNLQVVRSLKAIKLLATVEIASSICKVIILIILFYLFNDKYDSVYALFLSNFIMAIVSFYIVFSLFNSKKKDSIDSTNYYEPTVKYIFSISLPMFLTSGMIMLILQIDTVMLSMYSTLKAVGIYAVIVKLAGLSIFVTASINTIAGPKISELFHSGKMDELKNMTQKTTKFAVLITLPIILITIIFGKYLLSVFGSEFVEGYNTLIILLSALFISTTAGSEGYFLNMTGHQKVYNYILILSSMLNIGLNYLLIPKYGIEGAAVASLISKGFWMLIASLYIKRKFNFYICYIPFLVGKK